MVILSWIAGLVAYVGFVLTHTSKEFNILFGMFVAIWFAVLSLHEKKEK